MEVRIAGGPNIPYGRIEVNKYGFWGPICDKGWTDAEANAACKQLPENYTGGVSYYAESSESDLSPVLFSSFNCSDKSLQFADCPHKSFGEDLGCTYSPATSGPRKVAGVLCYRNGKLYV